ncbi:hypothetical protein BJY52DRAFT_1247122 [Lactarius psammicola]|nr:hypothetical protein BJY52DRAFT_1247122 [Lactarius psammicola]
MSLQGLSDLVIQEYSVLVSVTYTQAVSNNKSSHLLPNIPLSPGKKVPELNILGLRGVRPFWTSSLSDRAAWPSYHFGFTFPRCHTYFAHHRSLSSFPSFFPSISPLSLSIHSFAHPHAAMNRCRPPCKRLEGPNEGTRKQIYSTLSRSVSPLRTAIVSSLVSSRLVSSLLPPPLPLPHAAFELTLPQRPYSGSHHRHRRNLVPSPQVDEFADDLPRTPPRTPHRAPPRAPPDG